MKPPEPGQTIFTSSGVFNIPKGVKEIEVFAVGGGGHGSKYASVSNVEYSGGGGGGTSIPFSIYATLDDV